jgi:hypothetical protein
MQIMHAYVARTSVCHGSHFAATIVLIQLHCLYVWFVGELLPPWPCRELKRSSCETEPKSLVSSKGGTAYRQKKKKKKKKKKKTKIEGETGRITLTPTSLRRRREVAWQNL